MPPCSRSWFAALRQLVSWQDPAGSAPTPRLCRLLAALAPLNANLRGERQMRLPVMSGAAFGINWEDPRKEREAGRAAEEHLQGRDSGQDKWGLRALHRAAKEGGWLVVLSELDMGKRELVGEGTVGQVHKCKHLPSGDHCAVKGVRPSLSEDSLDRNRTMEDLVNEIKMLSSIGRHPNVVRFVGVLFDGSHASHEAVHQHETAHLSTNEASHEASRVCPAQPSACSTHFPVCPASHEATHEDNGDTHEADEARSRPHEEASRPALVLEYLAGRSLQDVIDDRSRCRPWRPPERLALSWCHQLCAALAFLHDRETPLVHRDIKASNLFCSPDLTRVKLGDFGLCRPVKNRADQRAMTGLTGSYMHMAPEVFLCQQDYSEKADIFSAAVCMVSLLTGRPPYERDFEQYGNFPDVLARRVAQEGYRMSLGAVHPAGMAPLISSMWDTDPACRPTAREARQEVTRVLVAAEKSVFQPIASLVTSVIASFEGVSRWVLFLMHSPVVAHLSPGRPFVSRLVGCLSCVSTLMPACCFHCIQARERPRDRSRGRRSQLSEVTALRCAMPTGSLQDILEGDTSREMTMQGVGYFPPSGPVPGYVTVMRRSAAGREMSFATGSVHGSPT